MSIFRLPLSVTARAGTNIALVKYWGKRDLTLNLPAAGSLSLTLANFGSETTVRFAPDAEAREGGDHITFDGAPAPPRFAERVRRYLDLIRREARVGLPAEVSTRNSVPTAAGLASSAAGFAASRAAGMKLSPPELSSLARQGSGQPRVRSSAASSRWRPAIVLTAAMPTRNRYSLPRPGTCVLWWPSLPRDPSPLDRARPWS
jgi:diphosphomevalonate decarboxylase